MLRDGCQQVSLLSTQGCVPPAFKEVSLNTRARYDTRKEKSVTFLDQSLKNQVERERRDLCHDPSRTACHTQEIPSPFLDFPCPLTLTNKAVCAQSPHEREGVKIVSTSQEKVLLL